MGYGKPTQAEFDEFEQIIRNAYEEGKKHIKIGKKPVNPTPTPGPAAALSLRVVFYLDAAKNTTDPANLPFELNISEDSEILRGLTTGSLEDLETLTQRLMDAVMKSAPEGYEADKESFRVVASAYLLGQPLKNLEVCLVKKQEVGLLKNVVAFDIRNGEWVYDRIYELRMRDGWTSVSDMAKAYYQNSETVQKDYLYAGFVTKDLEPCVVLREAYLEKPERWKEKYLKLLEETKADIVVLVVPKTMGITVEHIFPEGTQATLTETVNVPYIEWASLQTSFQFMNLPEIFRTRIQKVNDQGFAFQVVKFYSGLEEITGVLGAWDWVGMDLEDHTKKECKAKVFYQLAPENRVQAEGQGNVQAQVGAQAQSQAQANTQVQGPSQMSAQIKAQEVKKVQGPIAVAGASMSNRGNQVNSTLPVTGASDSIFLFLSSAALMAVGILFFKKH